MGNIMLVCAPALDPTCARHLPVGRNSVTPRNGDDFGMAVPKLGVEPPPCSKW